MRRTGIRSPLRLLTFIILLWLIGTALLADVWLIGLVLLIPGIVVLGLCVRSTLREDWGSVAAWAAFSLAPLGCLAIIALAHVHLPEFIGLGPSCDAIAQTCGPQIGQGLMHALPLIVLVVAGLATLRLIATSGRNADSMNVEAV